MGRPLGRLVAHAPDLVTPMPLKWGEGHAPPRPPQADLGFSRILAILFEAPVPGEIGRLRGEGEAAAALENDISDSQQNVLLDGEEGVLVLAAEVSENLQVLRVGAEADETDTCRLGGNHRMAEP